jgi:phage terminase large subunit GpA-like protein
VVGVDEAKLTLYRRIAKVTKPGPGYVHVPVGRDEEWFAQLTAEQLMPRANGVREWVKLRPRNEALDCRIYAYAALKLLHPDGVPRAPDPAMPQPTRVPPPAAPPRRVARPLIR